MEIKKAPNAQGTKISVSSTAGDLFDLINVAAGVTLDNAGYPPGVNGIIIQPEDGNIRVLFDGNTPTATEGFLVKTNSVGCFPNVPLKRMQLISVSGTVLCSIMIGNTEQGENIVISSASGDSSVVPSPIPVSSYVSGSKTVASAGTAEALAVSASFRTLTVQAKEANTGNVYLGGSGVDSTNGLTLPPTYSYTFNLPGDIADIYIDVDTNGEGVTYLLQS